MDILSIVIIMFCVLETSNILMLYFTPGTRRGNGMGVFNAYEKSKADPDIHALVRYLINWVAGTKLIFIALLIVILFTGSPATKIFSVVALILSILTFFWRLYPAIKGQDKEGHITPAGYSKTLGIMIAGFVVIFSIALILSLVLRAA
ncbi:MAG: hypothetical protein JEZ04_08775 [Spirochaetales bacterium]|nr:hypothetical protein [Spirochaetales bacterium]